LELLSQHNRFELKERLTDYLLFGSYPDVLTAPTREEKIDQLTEITESYLLKDILELDQVQSPQAVIDLVKLLAFQIGSEVSLSELATQLGIDFKTVGRYIYLLEQCFVIVRVGGFSRNLCSEVKRKGKYYFLDTGVRNFILSQFNHSIYAMTSANCGKTLFSWNA
jgi:uncharacterized protein